MATTTTNLGLTKQAPGEHASLVALNGNFDLIDDFAGNAIKQMNPTVFNDDCNNVSETCVLYVGNSASNSPGSWYIMKTIYYSSDAIVQYAFSVTDNVMKMRSKATTWSAWRTVAYTNNRGYADVTIPVGTTAGSYKVGTFTTLNIPYGAAILCAQCINVTGSICVVTGVATYDQDIYVYIAQDVSVANGNVRITFVV